MFEAGKESAPYPVVPVTDTIASDVLTATRVLPPHEIYLIPVREASAVPCVVEKV
jgi:hypothetical protein